MFSMSRVLAALVLDLMLGSVLSSGRLYTIPENWEATIAGNEHPFRNSGSYVLVNAPSNNNFVVSESGIFGLAFVNFNGAGSFYLSVVMGLNATSGTPIWTANRGRAVSNESRLVKTNGQLKFLDGLETVWSPSDQNIQSISLEETGNLILYGSSKRKIWQSFDYPTDVLLPGQKLVTRQRLTSNLNSSTMSEGVFTATMEASGMVLAYNPPSGEQQPYFLWSLRTPPTVDLARTPCQDYHAVLQYYNGAINITYEANSTMSPAQSPCSSPFNQALVPAGNSTRYLRLESDGDLISYKLNETGDWETEFWITQWFGNHACDLPLRCGSYGLCGQAPAQCSCLRNEVSNITVPASDICETVPTWPSLPETCDSKYKTDFVVLPQVRHFSNLHTSPDRVLSSLEECVFECRANCSCSALFYDTTLRNCYFVRDASGGLTQDVSNYMAYLKFQDRTGSGVDSGNPSTYRSGRRSRWNSSPTIIICSIVAATTVSIVCLLLLLLKLRRKQQVEEIEKLITALQGPPQRFDYKTLMLATNRFSKCLGTGGFGSVYEGVLNDGQKLAVKRLHSCNDQKQFIAEVASLGTTSHVNIVRLCGFCTELSHRLLVYEFMPNGSLDKWIFGSEGAALDWDCRYNIALGTARGLAYLHEESREPIIHLDIKPQNILLGDNFEAKVGDFGMAKLLMRRDVSKVITGVRGTPGYLAPEWVMYCTATKKCDVYSYGMVLLELIGGRKNLDPTRVDSEMSFFFPVWAVNEIKQGRLLNVVDLRIRDGVDSEGAERMIKVAFWCIQENPAERPTMDAVVQMLEGRLEIAEPPLNFRFVVEAPGVVGIKANSNSPALAYFNFEENSCTSFNS